MQTKLQQIKWSSYRTIFLTFMTLSILTGGAGIYILAPITSYYFFNDYRFWKHHKHFPKIILMQYGMLLRYFKNKDYRETFTFPYSQPPMLSPDPTKVKISDNWKHNQEDCIACHESCCLKIKCRLYDPVNNNCRSYNSFYWKYFNCGRFPLSWKQIDFFNCSKWELKEPRAVIKSRGQARIHLSPGEER